MSQAPIKQPFRSWTSGTVEPAGLCSKTLQCTGKPETMSHAAGKRAIPGGAAESANVCGSEVIRTAQCYRV